LKSKPVTDATLPVSSKFFANSSASSDTIAKLADALCISSNWNGTRPANSKRT